MKRTQMLKNCRDIMLAVERCFINNNNNVVMIFEIYLEHVVHVVN